MLSLFLLFSIFTLSECHIIFSNDYHLFEFKIVEETIRKIIFK